MYAHADLELQWLHITFNAAFNETRVIHRFREQRLRERGPHPHSVFYSQFI